MTTRAAATASSLEWTPRARKRRRTWFLTVSVLRWSSAAICFVERPCSSSRSTSTWRGVRCGCGADRQVGGASLDLPEDTDDPLAVLERHRAELDIHPRAGGRNQDAGRLGGRRSTEHLARERLAGSVAVLGCNDRGEVATTNIAEEPLGGRVDPADDSRCVEDVARDTDAAESLLDIATDSKTRSHHGQAADLPTEHNVVVAPPDAAQTLDCFMPTSCSGSTSITLSAIVQQTRVLVILTKG